MKRTEYDYLLAERDTLIRLIAETAEEFPIDRASLESRLEGIRSEIEQAVVDEREPKVMTLAFHGQPVIGARGILAEFGSQALGLFTEMIAALAAAAEAPLADKGRIPKREQNQLLITAAARGSFGFVLEEHHQGQLRLDEETPTMQAMAQIHALLRGLVGTDEDLADAASGIPARAMDLLRSYLELLIQANAYSTVVVDGQEARFRNIGEIERGLIRIRRENLVAVERVLKGQFVGILPEARTFEFFAEGIDHVVRGKLASGVPAGILRKRLDETMSIRIIETRVRSGRPRYSVINAPLPGAESGTES